MNSDNIDSRGEAGGTTVVKKEDDKYEGSYESVCMCVCHIYVTKKLHYLSTLYLKVG